MIKTTFAEICTPELQEDAITNIEYPGFREDYLVLHCLIRKFKPESFLEIGTNMGTGTRIICNANPAMKVFSLDLPPDQAHKSLQHPISEGKGHNIGRNCVDFPFTQLFGDSMEFDYDSQVNGVEGWYIDGEHDTKHAHHESTAAIRCGAKLIVWHDTDMPEVMAGILAAFEGNKDYELYRVTDTRVSFALKI